MGVDDKKGENSRRGKVGRQVESSGWDEVDFCHKGDTGLEGRLVDGWKSPTEMHWLQESAMFED